MKRTKGFSHHEAIVRKSIWTVAALFMLYFLKRPTIKKPNALGRLVWSGTSRIIDDFEALLDTSTWAPMLMELAEDASQAKDMLTAALGTVLRNYAGTVCRER